MHSCSAGNWNFNVYGAIALNQNENATDPIEDEHHIIFAFSGYVYARQLFQIFPANPSQLPEPAQSQSCSQASHMG